MISKNALVLLNITDYISQGETMAKPQFGGNDKIYYYLGKWLAGEVEAYSVSLDGSSPQFELMVRSKETPAYLFEKSEEELGRMSEEELLPKLWYLDDGGYTFKRDGSKAIVVTCERFIDMTPEQIEYGRKLVNSGKSEDEIEKEFKEYFRSQGVTELTQSQITWLQMFDPVSKRLFEVPYRNLCCNAYPFAWTD